eukprot:7519313-Ditylum_brightwellii.AAC.1
MHTVLWKSFTCPIKTAMQKYTERGKIDGPALLYHLLRQYTETAESVIRTYQLNLNNLTNKLEMLEYNVDKFCDYTTKTLKTLCNAGGNGTQASLKLYEALTSLKVDAFNSKIRAYKAAVSVKDKTLDFTKLTTIACTEDTSLVMRGQWPSSPKTATKK